MRINNAKSYFISNKEQIRCYLRWVIPAIGIIILLSSLVLAWWPISGIIIGIGLLIFIGSYGLLWGGIYMIEFLSWVYKCKH